MNRLINYIKDTRAEMRHVTWPTRRQVVIYTIIVVMVSLATAALLGFFDFLFTRALEFFVL